MKEFSFRFFLSWFRRLHPPHQIGNHGIYTCNDLHTGAINSISLKYAVNEVIDFGHITNLWIIIVYEKLFRKQS